MLVCKKKKSEVLFGIKKENYLKFIQFFSLIDAQKEDIIKEVVGGKNPLPLSTTAKYAVQYVHL